MEGKGRAGNGKVVAAVRLEWWGGKLSPLLAWEARRGEGMGLDTQTLT